MDTQDEERSPANALPNPSGGRGNARPRRHDEYPETFVTRLFAAVVLMVAVAITMVLIPLVFSFGYVGVGRSGPNQVSWGIFGFIFSRWGLIIILAAGVFAFAGGSDRAMTLLSTLWGTNDNLNRNIQSGIEQGVDVDPAWLEEHPLALAVFVVVLALIGFGIWFLVHRA
jgi:hypothetical protein